MQFTEQENLFIKSKYLTTENVKFIISKHGVANGDAVENYYIQNASYKMLGFLCDYWKLKVQLTPKKRVLHYFLKLISVSNTAKAKMVEELKLFEKELHFYAIIKERIQVPDMKLWSAPFIACLKNIMVFEDLNVLEYKLRDKFKRFDKEHTIEALKTLTRLHACSIIYEEKRSKELGRVYSLNEDFAEYLCKGGYENNDIWFSQCRNGCLEALKTFSKYSKTEINMIESRWFDVWSAALAQTDQSSEYRNVICHRDLWNNNFMFHYTNEGKPDDCLLIDFQAVRYHPPAGDVMLLLCCNLDPKYREKNMENFLNVYIKELRGILLENGIEPSVINKDLFFESAERQRQWGLIASACLIPQFWIDDDKITQIFTDTVQFDKNLSKDKASFITQMMQSNPGYKEKVMEIFEEIVDREKNMENFLNVYIKELRGILLENGIEPSVINKDLFFESAERQRQWGLIASACLIPQFWIDDDKITQIFTDTVQFDKNLSKDKASFITQMMQSNPGYKEKVMEIFEEIVDRYCL